MNQTWIFVGGSAGPTSTNKFESRSKILLCINGGKKPTELQQLRLFFLAINLISGHLVDVGGVVFAEEAIVRKDGAFLVFVPLVRADLLDLEILVPVSHLGVVVVVRLPVQSVVLDFETILPLVEDLQSILKSKDNESLTAELV